MDTEFARHVSPIRATPFPKIFSTPFVPDVKYSANNPNTSKLRPDSTKIRSELKTVASNAAKAFRLVDRYEIDSRNPSAGFRSELQPSTQNSGHLLPCGRLYITADHICYQTTE